MSERTCAISGCESPVTSRGWCGRHYERWRRHGDPTKARVYERGRRGCLVEDCDRPHKARGYCGTHYRRVRVNGEPGTAELLVKPYDPTATEKKCTGCGVVKPLSEYHRVYRRSQYVARCKICRNEEIRIIQLQRRYNLTDSEYEEMLLAQGGICEVCDSTHRLCVDHDHATGKVRAILCDRCNRALGVVDDDIELLNSLVKYLKRH